MYKAKVSFSGIISMSVGDVGEIADASIAKDLLKAGYIEEVQPADKVKADKVKSDKKPTSRAKKSGGK